MANSNAKVQAKTLDDGYCLVVDGEESEVTGYGEPLEFVTSDGRRFVAFLDAEGKDVVTSTEFWAYEALPVVDVPILEDEDEDEEDEDDNGDGDEDDQDEEQEDEPELDQATK